ncbi:MAG: hypothetical protein NTV05_14290 [Acidobacteria bacterium]|nr:hypothetical protein [Acidobacteriota bacterium]
MRPLPAWILAGLALLVLLRVPAVVQPLGLDQGAYSYVGQRILAGDVPYRDVWDHKPPGLHLAYAFMWYVWPNEGVVPLTDAALAAGVALLLLAMAPRLTASRGAGPLAAALFLFLGNPSLARYGGVRVRGQGEAFIAVFVTAAVWCALRAAGSAQVTRPVRRVLVAGVLISAAALVKYQAGIFVVAVWAAVFLPPDQQERAPVPLRERLILVGWSVVGLAVPLLMVPVVFAALGAFRDFWDATVAFNLGYSQATYESPFAFVRFLATFPVRQARVDGLWLLGGAGSLVVAWKCVRRPSLTVPLVWIAVACVAIAVNGSRGLPQYFIQASPALALVAGIAGAEIWGKMPRASRLLLVALAVWAVSRVVSIPDGVNATTWDSARLVGRIDEATYLTRFGGRPGDKYSVPDLRDLASQIRARTAPADPVYVFGFSPAAYVYAERRSASRLFFSTPVVSAFGQRHAGYGSIGLLADLRGTPPALVALQRDDAGPGGKDSRAWFLADPQLGPWLWQHYRQVESLPRYDLWERR